MNSLIAWLNTAPRKPLAYACYVAAAIDTAVAAWHFSEGNLSGGWSNAAFAAICLAGAQLTLAGEMDRNKK